MNSKSTAIALNLLIVVAILVVVNYIVGGLGFLSGLRADLTEKKIFTLSAGTKNLLANLNPDKPTTIRLYVTRDNQLMPQWAQSYSSTVQDLLIEIEKNAKGKIKLERIDPRPDTEDEDRAAADDIQGHPANENGDKAYFGMAIECLQQKEVIPVMNPNEESNLEYQIARAIAKVSRTKNPVVGVMSPMPIAGPAFNFPGMQQQQPPPWMMIRQLRLDYDVREVPMSTDKIDDDVQVILLVHPYGISKKAEFALDQFVLRGGKLVAFVDPQCLTASRYDRPGQMGMAPTVATSPMSDLPTLLRGWGVSYDKSRIVADQNFRSPGQTGRPVATFLTVPPDYINREETTTSTLGAIQLYGAGGFAFLEKKEGVTYTTLAESSELSGFVDLASAELAQREGIKDFASDGRRKALAVRLSGKFPTAFPEGAPKDESPADTNVKLPGEAGGEEKKDAGAPDAAKDKKDEKKEEKPAALKEGNGQGIVFLFSDADMESDGGALRADAMGRVMAVNSNLPMLLNVMEFLTGGSDLINVRSRAVTRRPFTKMQEIKLAVESKYEPLVQQKEKEMQKIVEEITAKGVQPDGKGNGIIVVNPEEIRKLRDQQVALQKDIRTIRKEQNRDKDRKEMQITALNILGIPLLLVAFGVTLAVRRSSLRAAH
jgi:ABC-type uncharacterized transport system involved in gliding motility auxiliary subunit